VLESMEALPLYVPEPHPTGFGTHVSNPSQSVALLAWV
jgi:hypothetical protein